MTKNSFYTQFSNEIFSLLEECLLGGLSNFDNDEKINQIIKNCKAIGLDSFSVSMEELKQEILKHKLSNKKTNLKDNKAFFLVNHLAIEIEQKIKLKLISQQQ